ncbi:MAG TPA: WYL domain-containing protein [Thermodesulfobacteriota bacterium]|nr:WYL domain-containing protein [Thermodesulfobacteriota bacterium]
MLRLIWFDQQLRAQKFPTARDYAERFEITLRTAYRDVEYFREQLNLPISYDPKQGGYCYTEPNAPVPPVLTLTEGELVAIYIAQRVLEQYEGTQFGALLAHAFGKISALLTDRVTIDLDTLRDGFSFYVGPPGRLEVEMFAKASRAVRERKPLAIEYLTQSRGELTRRVVDPYHLHNHAGAWYLIGFDHRTRSVRTFHLSRVRKAALQSKSFERPTDFDIKAYLRESFAMMRGARIEQVAVRFDPDQARYVAERTWHPTERREWSRDGRLTLRFELSGLEGVKRWVLSYGSHAEVLAPASLRREVAAEAQRMAALYRPAGLRRRPR